MQEELGQVVREERGGRLRVGCWGEGAGVEGGGGLSGVEEGHLSESAGGRVEGLGVDGGIGESEGVSKRGNRRRYEGVSAQTH